MERPEEQDNNNDYAMIRDAVHSFGNDVFLFSDADPDGTISAAIFGIYRKAQGKRFDAKGMKLTRKAINAKDVQKAKAEGYDEIAGLDFWPIYDSTEAIAEIEKERNHFKNVKIMDHHPSPKEWSSSDVVKVVNPYLKSERTFKNMTELLYGAVKDEFKNEKVRKYARDLNAIGIMADYCADGGQLTLAEVVNDYKDVFPQLKKKLDETGKIAQEDLTGSDFAKFSEMVYAPYITRGEEGAVELARLCVDSEPFSLRDLLNSSSKNPAIGLMNKEYGDCNADIERAISGFKQNARFDEESHTAFYTPPELKYWRATSMLSNKTANQNPEWIVGIKLSGYNGVTAYDFRNRSYDDVPLGEIFKKMGIGGGHEKAAGCRVESSNAKYFETAFTSISRDCMHERLSQKPKQERDAALDRIVKSYWK